MGYMTTYADQLVAGTARRSAAGLFANPAVIASTLILSAGLTFFGVKSLASSKYVAPPAEEDESYVVAADLEPFPELETAMLTETSTVTTTTTTTTTTATTTVPTTVPSSVSRSFSRAFLLGATNYPEVHIPNVPLPAQYGNGLLDPEAAFYLINAVRAQNGLPAYERGDSTLGNAAFLRSREILTDFSQTRPNGSDYSTALDEYGIGYEHCLESIGYGQYTAEHIVSDWMSSPKNLANILNTNCTQIYIVCEMGNDNIPVWTMLGIMPTE